MTLKEKLLSRIEIVAGRLSTPCWEWTGARHQKGYGSIYWEGELIRTHRASWQVHRGPIPDEMLILHRCHNPPCCNPDHLYVGTDQDNSLDTRARKAADDPRPERSRAEKDRRQLNALQIATLTGQRPARPSVESAD